MGSLAHRVMKVSLVLCVILGIATPVVWGIGIFVFDNSGKYGTVDMPGTATLHFPKGEVDIFYGAYVGESCCDANNQSEANNLGIPDALSISVIPVRGGLVPGMETSYGSQITDNGNAHQRVAKMDVPVAGAYRVSVSGGVGAEDERVQFGEPNPAGSFLVIGASLFLGLALLTVATHLVARGASGSGSPVGDEARVGFGFMTGSVALIAVIALPVVLISHSSLNIRPSGRVSAGGQSIQASQPSQTSSTPSQTAIVAASTQTEAESTPVPAAGPASLFKTRNFAPVLADASRRLGAKANVMNIMLFPGEMNVDIDTSDGDGQLVVIDHTGAITRTAPRPLTTSPRVIYLSQVDARVPQLLVRELVERYHVKSAQVASMDLVTDLPGNNAGWRIALEGSSTSYEALLDGSDLRRLAGGSAA